MDNEDVGGAGESIPLILTYFMIMKRYSKNDYDKSGLPHWCARTAVQLGSRLRALNERITQEVKKGSIST